MRFWGGVFPFIGVATRYLNDQGYCLATKEDAIELVCAGEKVFTLEVFEISWLDRYIWPWTAEGGFFITGYGVRDNE